MGMLPGTTGKASQAPSNLEKGTGLLIAISVYRDDHVDDQSKDTSALQPDF